jgi:hypothetical protein
MAVDDDARREALRSALHKAVKGTPLALFPHIVPEGETVSERFNATLDDGSTVIFERRTTATQRTDAFLTGADGASQPLPDGEYRLKAGISFRVVSGRLDFDAILKDPDGVEPFRQYDAWKEVVAIENPLFSLPDPSLITDVVRFLAPDDRSYYAVQLGADQPYQAFVVVDHRLQSLADGKYPLPNGQYFKVERGHVHPESLPALKVHAYDSTRLPR